MKTVATSSARVVLRVLGGSISRRVLGVVLFLAAWELGSYLADNRLFPSLDACISSLYGDFVDGSIIPAAAHTFTDAFAALGIAIVVGIPMGIGIGRSRILGSALEPLVSATYPMPIIALYPVMILIFGLGGLATIILVALSCAYPLVISTIHGVRDTKKQYFWLADAMGSGAAGKTGILLRSSALSIAAGLRIAVPTMLVITLICEMTAGNQGLGFRIVNSGTLFEPAEQMATIFFVALCGFILDRLLVYGTWLVVFWERGGTVTS